jgi:nucleoside 2-deoxyribosyltransferase
MADDKLHAFISGTASDLRDYRQAALDACMRVGVIPITIESSAATDEAAVVQTVVSAIDRSDIYLAIIGQRYGSPSSKKAKSFTEMEYELAGERRIPRLVFIKREEKPSSFGPGADEAMLRLQSFTKMVRQSGLVTEFRSVDEFKTQIITALVDVVSSLSRKSEPKSVLLLLPFGGRHEKLRRFLSDALQEIGLVVYRLDDAPAGALLANLVTDALRRADIVIADVTDANPNVMYELGYVQSLRKPTIILAESSSMGSVPSDLMGNRVLTYESDDLNALQKPLTRFLQEFNKEEWRR